MGHNSADYIHTVIEAAKLSFADREAYYGDPEFIDVPLDGLLSDRYAAIRRELIDSAHASMEQRPGDPIAMRALRDAPAAGARPWGGGTIHVTAADRDGNLIAVTASGGWIPSSPVIEALGFPLGTRMQTFYLDERHPNALMPGKRPRTTLSPSLAMRKGEPYLAFGTPGGDQQDQWTLQFFLNVVDFAMDLQAAIEAPKFSTPHFPSTFYPHDNRPGVVRIEDRVPPTCATRSPRAATRSKSVHRGPRVTCSGVQINTQTGVLAGGADPRGQAAAGHARASDRLVMRWSAGARSCMRCPLRHACSIAARFRARRCRCRHCCDRFASLILRDRPENLGASTSEQPGSQPLPELSFSSFLLKKCPMILVS